MDQIRARLDYLKTIKPNWDNHDEQIPEPETFEFVYKIIKSLIPIPNSQRLDIGLSDDAGIEVDVINYISDRFIGFTFYKQHVDCYINHFHDIVQSQHYSCQYVSIDTVVTFVKKHIV